MSGDSRKTKAQLLEEIRELRQEVGDLKAQLATPGGAGTRLQGCEEGFRQLAESMQAVFWLGDADWGRFHHISPVYETVWGRSCESLLQDPRSWLDGVHEEDRPAVMKGIEERSAGQTTGQASKEYRVVRPDGTVRWVHARVFPVVGPEGSVSRIAGIVEDITDRKQKQEALRASEERFRRLVDLSPVAMVVTTLGFEILDINREFVRLFGYTLSDIQNLESWRMRAYPDAAYRRTVGELWLRAMEAAEKSGSPSIEPVEVTVTCKDRSSRVVLASMTSALDRRLLVFLDLTEQRRFEEALRRSERQYRMLFQSMTSGFALHEVITDQEGRPCDYRYLDVNPAFEELTGLGAQDLIGRTVREMLPGTELEWIEQFGAVAVTGKSARFESYHAQLGKHYDVMAYSPEPGQFAVVALDITERKRNEEALRRTSSFLSAVIDQAPFAVLLCEGSSLDWELTTTNREARRIIGIEPDARVGVGMKGGTLTGIENVPYELIRPNGETWPLAEAPICVAMLEEETILNAEMRIRRADGAESWVLCNAAPVYDDDGSLIGALVMYPDITDFKRAEEASRRAHAFLKAVIDQAPFGVLVCEGSQADWQITMGNREAQRINGVTEEQLLSIGARNGQIREPDCPMWEMFRADGTPWPPSETPLVLAMTQRKVTADEEMTIRRPDGVEMTILCNTLPIYGSDGAVIGAVGTFPDITDRKRAQEERIQLERQIQHTQKLESLGVLAGGIAHDFNNILMAILGHADMALEELSPMAPARENIDEIEKASRRAAELCRQMLAYSGKGKFVTETIQIGVLIDEMLHLLKTSIPKGITLNLNLSKSPCTMHGDATQIRQVIMNLVLNASEAIGDRSGVIAISAGTMECSSDYLADVCFDEQLAEGSYVFLDVRDTGCGMDGPTVERLFEPFFTTKFTGRGLGMSAVLGIVRGHKGAIRVDSEVGQGSTFRVLFPAVEPEGGATRGGTPDEARKWTGSGRVLLVDDEETILSLGEKMLRRIGFDVVTAKDGCEALEVYAARKGEIDVVLLDLTMPRMNGEEAFRELRRLDPDVHVIMSSGYTEHEISPRFAGKGLAGFIQKPYNLSALRESLRSIQEGAS